MGAAAELCSPSHARPIATGPRSRWSGGTGRVAPRFADAIACACNTSVQSRFVRVC